MTDDEEQIVNDAFQMIGTAISRIDGPGDIDAALDEICDAVNRIEPDLLLAAEQLTTDEIGDVLAAFSERSKRATQQLPGNTPEQTFLVMVVLGAIRQRARQDGLPALEWCRRERIRGFLKD
jgi:hypothetical protein